MWRTLAPVFSQRIVGTVDGIRMLFAVKVNPAHKRIVPRTAFDPPASVTFETRERAEGWCAALNRCLGYDRYIIEELSEDGSVQ